MFEKFKKRLKKRIEKERAIEAGEPEEGPVESLSTTIKAAKIIGKNLNRDYLKTGSVDLVELITNSLDVTMGVMVQLGIGRELKTHWEYYVGFHNCCYHEWQIEAVAPDIKSKLLYFHNLPVTLNRFTQEEYEQATIIAVKRKKEDIMKFWDEYVENQIVG